MARNDLPKLIEALEKAAVAVGYEAPRQAAKKIVDDLQDAGPSWSGRFSNSWVVDISGGLPGSVKGTGAEGDARSLKLPAVAFASIKNKVNVTDQIVFTVGNFSEYASQAIDETPDLFFRPFFPPKTALGRQRVQQSDNNGGPRGGRTMRGALPPGDGGSSRTADLDWFKTYNNAGKRDKVINTFLSKALRSIR